MIFEFNGDFKDVKPHLDNKFPGSNCGCAFCVFVFRIPFSKWSLTDKEKFKAHLALNHGWLVEQEMTA